MSRGRLDEKICWYDPRKDAKWQRQTKKRCLVYVHDHTYEGESGYGGISNVVIFSRVLADGSISRKGMSAYDYGQFTPTDVFTLTKRVVKACRKFSAK